MREREEKTDRGRAGAATVQVRNLLQPLCAPAASPLPLDGVISSTPDKGRVKSPYCNQLVDIILPNPGLLVCILTLDVGKLPCDWERAQLRDSLAAPFFCPLPSTWRERRSGQAFKLLVEISETSRMERGGLRCRQSYETN